MKLFIKSAAIGLTVLHAGIAYADTYKFSYTYDVFAGISGEIDGTAAGNILTVNDVKATFESTGGVFGISSYSLDTSLGGYDITGNNDNDPGTLGLDGSSFDLVVLSGIPFFNNCFNVEGFCLLDQFSLASAYFGGTGESYTLNSENFSIEPVGPTPAPVPLPASLPLLLAGLGAVGFVRRSRRYAAV